jgi:hypothetical protein
LLVGVVSGLAIAASCSVKQIAPVTPALSTIARGQRVLLLPTQTIYESVATGRELSVPPPEAAEHAARLDEAVRARLASAGFEVVHPEQLPPGVRADVERVFAGMRALYVPLIGITRDREAFRPPLAELERLSGTEVLCVPIFFAKVGTGGGYDPNSGAIWTTTSSTSVRLGLISLATGERIWFREAFMRSIARNRDLERAIEALFRDT